MRVWIDVAWQSVLNLFDLNFNSRLTDVLERPGLFCPTKRNFSFVIKRYFICNGCKDQKEVVEIFRDLSVEIFDYEDIEQWNKSLYVIPPFLWLIQFWYNRDSKWFVYFLFSFLFFLGFRKKLKSGWLLFQILLQYMICCDFISYLNLSKERANVDAVILLSKYAKKLNF